ncbi:hypothetical protein BFP77_13495 [Maribacter sp. 4U21]|uniref:hypothetical protein n=1 Tax=Maribacter sp. 4U21 TaxID=1889779 RepID=UPI000C15CB91|nr:hypothetical protein [Maribacter sp. 4U21]PIB27046.1 hypothetical protein BFP77_13495 [Maribacter sp. 4U21]
MNIIADGANNYKNTKEFRLKKEDIIREVHIKYSSLISNEKNFYRRIRLYLKRRKETLKELSILCSKEIHYFKNQFE